MFKMFNSYTKSQRYHRKNNITHLKPILKLASLIACYPPFNFEVKQVVVQPWYRIYSASYGIMTLLGASLSIWFGVFLFYNETVTSAFFDVTEQIFITLFIVNSNFGISFWNRKNYHKILNNMVFLEKNFTNSNKKMYNFLIIEMCVIHFVLIMFYVYYYLYFMVLKELEDSYLNLIVIAMQYYFIFQNLCLLKNIILCVGHKLKLLNVFLLNLEKQIFFAVTINDKSNKSTSKFAKNIEDIILVRNNYIILADTICKINKAFGISFILIYFIMFIHALALVNIILVYDAQDLVLFAMWTSYLLVSLK